jgi:tRNA pseudouridine(55) synthase
VGHSGTLDPDATGVLVLGVGRATRLLTFLSGLPKRYVGEGVLGTATSTLDASGEVTGTWTMGGVGLDEVRRAAAGLTGDLEQGQEPQWEVYRRHLFRTDQAAQCDLRRDSSIGTQGTWQTH